MIHIQLYVLLGRMKIQCTQSELVYTTSIGIRLRLWL